MNMPRRRTGSAVAETPSVTPADRCSVAEVLALQQDHWSAAAGVEHQLSMLVSRIAEHTHQGFAQEAAQHGLTLTEFDVLATLRRRPPPHEATPGDLQRAVLISSGGLTKVLDHLEDKALVARTTHPLDGRSRMVGATRQGLRAVERAMAAGLQRQAALLDTALSAPERLVLVKLLKRWADRL